MKMRTKEVKQKGENENEGMGKKGEKMNKN